MVGDFVVTQLYLRAIPVAPGIARRGRGQLYVIIMADTTGKGALGARLALTTVVVPQYVTLVPREDTKMAPEQLAPTVQQENIRTLQAHRVAPFASHAELGSTLQLDQAAVPTAPVESTLTQGQTPARRVLLVGIVPQRAADPAATALVVSSRAKQGSLLAPIVPLAITLALVLHRARLAKEANTPAPWQPCATPVVRELTPLQEVAPVQTAVRVSTKALTVRPLACRVRLVSLNLTPNPRVASRVPVVRFQAQVLPLALRARQGNTRIPTPRAPSA